MRLRARVARGAGGTGVEERKATMDKAGRAVEAREREDSRNSLKLAKCRRSEFRGSL